MTKTKDQLLGPLAAVGTGLALAVGGVAVTAGPQPPTRLAVSPRRNIAKSTRA
jgi:hypothetical protein